MLIESYGPGVAERLGLGFEDVRARSPDIVYCTVSAFGGGPVGRTLPGYDSLIQGFSGMMSITGHPDGPPARVAPSAIDLSTGLVVASSRSWRRSRAESTTDGAQHVDGGADRFRDDAHGPSGHEPPRDGQRAAARSAPPRRARRPTRRSGLRRLGGRGHRKRRPVRSTVRRARRARARRRPALRNRRRTASSRATHCGRCSQSASPDVTVDAWVERLAAAGVAAGRLQDLHEALEHPLTRERGVLVRPDAGGDRKTCRRSACRSTWTARVSAARRPGSANTRRRSCGRRGSTKA